MANYYKYDKKLVYSSKKEFIKLLNQIEEEFYTHRFVSDKRYSCIGRQRFLIDEILNKKTKALYLDSLGITEK